LNPSFPPQRVCSPSLLAGMIRHPIVDRSFLGRLLSSCLLSASSMICGQAFWSPTPSAGRHWTWTSTRVCSEHQGSPQTYVRPPLLSVPGSRMLTVCRHQRGCRMAVHSESRHIVILRRGQFCASLFLLVYKYVCFEEATPKLLSFIDWFDVLDDDNLPVLTEREVLRNLQAIISDADSTDRSQVSKAPRPDHYGISTNFVVILLGCPGCHRCPLDRESQSVVRTPRDALTRQEQQGLPRDRGQSPIRGLSGRRRPGEPSRSVQQLPLRNVQLARRRAGGDLHQSVVRQGMSSVNQSCDCSGRI
jgi:hypothetical protein